MTDMDNRKVMLVAMPWQEADILSIEIGALKAFLTQNKIKCDARHYYKDIVDYIDTEFYSQVLASNSTGELLFGAILFPEKYANIKKLMKERFGKSLDFDGAVEGIRNFMNRILEDVDWRDYALVGFTTTHSQLLSSITLANMIKQKSPDTKIVLGGILLTDFLAEKVLRLFPHIDFVIIGEGERPLLKLTQSLQSGSSLEAVPALCRMHAGKFTANKTFDYVINLNELPTPDYDDYFDYSLMGMDGKNFQPKIALEASRGCWWGKCTFCVENIEWRRMARRKRVEKVVDEIKNQTRRYKSLDIIFCDPDTANKIDIFKKIAELEMDLRIFAEVTGFISKESLRVLKLAGMKTIQIGVESFSGKLIKEFNKGVSLMKMVELMKWCKEFDIALHYNIILGAPFETIQDVEEITKKMNYLDFFQPPHTSSFSVSYGSHIYYSLEKYGITELMVHKDIADCYPKEIGKELTPFLSFNSGYAFKPENKIDHSKLMEKLAKWREDFKRQQKPSMICYRGESFLDIESRRAGRSKHTLITDQLERDLYLYCIDRARDMKDIANKFGVDRVESAGRALEKFVYMKIMFADEGKYLSIASMAGRLLITSENQGMVNTSFVNTLRAPFIEAHP